MDFESSWTLQTDIHKALIANKRADYPIPAAHQILFVEHPHVYTLGKSGSVDHLLLNQHGLEENNVTFFKINRGGDITYHGPGQMVVYPIFDLDCFFTDVHKYVRFLEEAVIRLLDTYAIIGKRIKGYTGVWLEGHTGQPNRKICAIGVHLSRWVTLHGLALNVNTDLNYFNHIIPCGIQDDDKTVTSISKELGKEIDFFDCKMRLKAIFADLFEYSYK